MRILILAGWYPNQINPMKGIFVREQASALKQSGLPVAVFYPFDEEIAPGKLEKSLEQGLEVYRANVLGFRNRYLARIASYITGVKRLKEVVESFCPDLLHVHVGYPAGILAYLFTRGTRLPYVVTEHMSYLKDYVEKWQHRILLKPAFEQAARVLPVSSALAKKIEEFGWKVRIQVVPNVVDTDRFFIEREDLRVSLLEGIKPSEGFKPSGNFQRINLLFAGNMEETQVKGLQFLLPAFAEVRVHFQKENPQKSIHLHLVGDGPKRPDYEKLAQNLGIKEHCTFYGRVNPERMPDFYQMADLFVSSSLKETFGCVLIEAMACGKPVLATECGGPQEIVKDNVGILVEPGSVEALVRGLKCAIQSLGRYDPEEIRQYAVEKYSPQALVKTLKEIYADIIREKK